MLFLILFKQEVTKILQQLIRNHKEILGVKMFKGSWVFERRVELLTNYMLYVKHTGWYQEYL